MFYNRLKESCAKEKTTITALLKEFNLSTGNTGSWKNGGMPSTEVLKKLSERLKVSSDYLLGNTDDPTPLGLKDYSADTEQSLDEFKKDSRYLFDSLSPEAKERALHYLRYLAQEDTK